MRQLRDTSQGILNCVCLPAASVPLSLFRCNAEKGEPSGGQSPRQEQVGAAGLKKNESQRSNIATAMGADTGRAEAIALEEEEREF